MVGVIAPPTDAELAQARQAESLAILAEQALHDGDLDTVQAALDESSAIDARLAASRERTWARYNERLIEELNG